MNIVKQAVDISFAQGIDTKTDRKRLAMGRFEYLKNKVFQKTGLLQKRNGYKKLATSNNSYLTTFKEALTALPKNRGHLATYSNALGNFESVGSTFYSTVGISTLPILRNNLTQTAVDIAVAPNGLACSAYLEFDGTNTTNKFTIFDSTTGQNILTPAVIPVSSGTVSGGMRVFVLGVYFIIVFTNTITATPHLQYIAINYNTLNISNNTDIAASYTPSSTLSFDGYVVNNRLFIAYDTTAGGQAIKVTYLTNSLVLATATTFANAAYIATIMSVTASLSVPSSPVIFVTFYDSSGHGSHALAVDYNLNVLANPTSLGLFSSDAVLNITTVATFNTVAIYVEYANNYSFTTGTGNATHYIQQFSFFYPTATAHGPFPFMRSVGLASKAFFIGTGIYFLLAYQSSYQSTYFLINANLTSPSLPAQVLMAKLAYSNGGGYLTNGLPSVSVTGDIAQVAYLFKDLIAPVNKNTAIAANTQVVGVYSQTGINLASFDFAPILDTQEMGNNLHTTGGFLWMYDGFNPVEHNFFLWPDIGPSAPPSPINSSVAAWSASGGSIAAQPDDSTNTNAYWYQVTYEWTDNQGNAFRSAPSIPIAVTTTGSGTSGSIVLDIPTLRITMKLTSPPKICIYRWSVAQPVYYQTTSITSPLMNDPTVDSVTFTDTNSDATILGNSILYTTGGVVEDVNANGFIALSSFDTRLFGIDAEDNDKLWYSKQVIENTPVEMSDLFTIFVNQTIGTLSPTGGMKCLAPMDDKLIIFKKGAILYINGTGPDNTGANSQFSEPTFVTSTVGCSTQNSIVLTPSGLMFQSDKGIWLLDRGLNVSYIGADVEDFTKGATVLSAINMPETTQVRFKLDSGITLMYDYFYGQWGEFTDIPAISSCIYQNVEAYLSSNGTVYMETPDQYLDDSNPVLMSFKTGPIRLGDLQNYQRAYFFYLLGTYISPHKLVVNIYYDYEPNYSQSSIIAPNNFSPAFGYGPSQSPYGQQNPYGGPSSMEDWRIFLERQRCMAINIEVLEQFDSTFGVPAGAGLTLSGINAVLGFKKGFRPQSADTTVG